MSDLEANKLSNESLTELLNYQKECRKNQNPSTDAAVLTFDYSPLLTEHPDKYILIVKVSEQTEVSFRKALIDLFEGYRANYPQLVESDYQWRIYEASNRLLLQNINCDFKEEVFSVITAKIVDPLCDGKSIYHVKGIGNNGLITDEDCT